MTTIRPTRIGVTRRGCSETSVARQRGQSGPASSQSWKKWVPHFAQVAMVAAGVYSSTPPGRFRAAGKGLAARRARPSIPRPLRVLFSAEVHAILRHQPVGVAAAAPVVHLPTRGGDPGHALTRLGARRVSGGADSAAAAGTYAGRST